VLAGSWRVLLGVMTGRDGEFLLCGTWSLSYSHYELLKSWFITLQYLQYSGVPLLPSSRRRLSYDDRLEDKRENYQKCSVLCCV